MIKKLNRFFLSIFTRTISFLFDEKYKWKQVLVINEQIVMNDIQLTKFGVAIVEENLQGLNIETISKTWSPVVFISDCNTEGLECNYEGLLVDLMNFLRRLETFRRLHHKLGCFSDKTQPALGHH